MLRAAGSVPSGHPWLCAVKLSRGTAVAVIALSVGGCGTKDVGEGELDTVAGSIVGNLSGDHAPLRIAYGKRWVIGGDVAVDVKGEFRVPSSARAVVAYVDANRNDRFDRYAEPSGDCELVSQSWTCSLVLQRTTVHRSISTRNADKGDQTFVIWEDYAPDGARVESSQLCVHDRCTELQAGPFVSRSPAQVGMLSLCGEEGFPDRQATVRGSMGVADVQISHPDRLEVAIRGERLQQPEGELLVHVQSPTADRLLVWAGRVNADSGTVTHVHWTSETAEIRMTDTPSGVELRIPSALVRTCEQDPACEIVIQVLEYWSPPGARVVSATESRSTVSFRGKP